MAYTAIPKDMSRVRTKIVMGLTQRQLVCFGSALITGLPVFLTLRSIISADIATLGFIAVCVPFFLLAMYERDGLPLERVLLYFVRVKYLRPKARAYRICNFYAVLGNSRVRLIGKVR